MTDIEPFEFGVQKNKFASAALSGKYSRVWVEESIDLSKDDGRGGGGNYLGTGVKKKRVLFLALIAGLGVLIILGKVFALQVVSGSMYREMAEGNRVRLRPIVSERGIIFDRFGKELVRNVPNFSLAIIPQDLPRDPVEKKKVVKKTVELSGADEDDLDRLIDKYGSYSYASLVVKENLDYESALKLIIQSANLPGVAVETGSKREYINGDSAATSTRSLSHLLGYTSKLNEEELKTEKEHGYLLFDNIGKTGLEKYYEHELRGQYGRKKVEVDAAGHEQSVLAEEPPVPGKNLTLTIDVEAQTKMESLISDYLKKSGKKKAVGIALDPRDGSVLAMISWPTFENNKFSGGIDQKTYSRYIKDPDNPLFNRAIGGEYPSGSIVKMLVAGAALQEGIITQKTSVLSTGGLRVDRWFFKDWNAGGHGITNVTKAIAWSVNTFFYYIGGGYDDFVGLGVEKIVSYLRTFGLGAKTGIDLPGEQEGFLPSKEWKRETKGEMWYVGDTYNLSIGQGDLLVTPLQAAVWTAAVANGGFVVKPHLVENIDNPAKKQSVNLKYDTRKSSVSAGNLAVVKQGMRECVIYGSCKLLGSLPFLAAGKTGTAQWSSTKDNHAWYTSFAPYDKPQIVVTILVEEGEEGSTVAQPIARDFLAWWGKKYLK